MIRIVRYSTSAAAVLLFLIAGAWLLLNHGTANAWADAMDRLAKVRNATCTLHDYRGGFDAVSQAYFEGSQIRVEDANRFCVTDLLQGKMLWVERRSKTAVIEDLKKDSDGLRVLGSNPLLDLVRMKDAPAERLPDEQIGDTQCHVFRVKDIAFMGFKVPWVKLWLDPQSKLPLRVHAVVANAQARTLDDFRWNEAFDKHLFELTVPEGYALVESHWSIVEESTAAAAQPGSPAHVKDAGAEEGREIPAGELANTLDMLGQRMEASYKAINSWSGTFDMKEHNRYTNPHNPQYEEISHANVEFFAEPGQERVRINYRDVEPRKILRNGHIEPVRELRESRWVRTREQLLRFSLGDLRHRVEGFPRIDGPGAGEAFRVLYREPSRAAEQYSHQGYVNPLTFFGNGQQYWKMCAMLADALRGKLGVEVGEYAKRNTTLRERGTGAGLEYVLIRGFKPDGTAKFLFSSKAGFNVVSFEFQSQRRLRQSENCTFRKENGAFIPCRVEFSMWEGNGGKGSKALPTQHRLFTLLKTQVNKPIDPVMFEVSSMGLREGDRVADLIEDRLEVFDGKHFVRAPESQRRPAPAAKHQDVGQQPSTNNMKQIGLAMHMYHQAKGTFPPAYVAGKDGKPLLSWRVLILPFLGQDDLYKQFHLDEPWDSEHNKTLIARMPAVYKSRNGTIEAEKTPYLTVRGPNTVFPGRTGISMAAISDGTSNTIMMVEVSDAKAVVWTQPDDFQYDPRDPKRGLLGAWPDGFLAGLADGSVRFVSASVDPTVLNAFFTRNGGEKIGPEALGR